MRARLFALLALALWSAPALAQDGEDAEPVRRVTAAFAQVKTYEQPAPDLPVPSATPSAEMRSIVGFAEYLAARDAYLSELQEVRRQEKKVDAAYSGMVLVAIEDLADAIENEEPKLDLSATAAFGFLKFKVALYNLHQADEARRKAGREMYRRFAPVFRILPRAEQRELLKQLYERTDELADGRRHTVALVEHYRRRYADRIERARRDVALGRGQTIADAASAVLGDPHLTRGYLWLVPETALHVEVTSEILRQAEQVVANEGLHPLLRQAFRDNPDLGPDEAIPPVGNSRAARLAMMRLRARRCQLNLHRREAQAEATFKRATSILSTSGQALLDAKRRSAVVVRGMKRNPDSRPSADPSRAIEQVGVSLLAEAAVAHQLLGDLFGTVVFQPAVDLVKNEALAPLAQPLGVEVKDSIRKAYDTYSKQKTTIEAQLRVLDEIVTNTDWAAAQATLSALRGEPGAGSILSRARRSTSQMLLDPELIESADGGLIGVFAPVCEHPRDVRNVHLAVASGLLTGNQYAAGARVGAARGVAGVDDPDATGPQLVNLVLYGPDDPMRGFPDRGFFNTWSYLAAEIPRALAVDWIYNLPSRVKNGLERLTGRAGGQDEHLKLMRENAVALDLLNRVMGRSDSDFDFERSAAAEPATWVHHEHLLANCYEYVEAHRRILADRAERKRLWLSAAHEVEKTSRDPAPSITKRGRVAISDVQVQDELDQARLTVRASFLRLRQLALTGEFSGAAEQLRALEPVAEHWLGMRSQQAVDLDYSAQVESLQVEGVRGEVVQVYDGLYKSALTETVVSLAATRLNQAVMAHKAKKGGIQFRPPKGVDKWSVVQSKLWNTLNPWAGTFSRGGVYGLVKNATVQASRETLAGALAKPLGVNEQTLDQVLDTVFSIVDDAHDQYKERYADAIIDDQSDPEVFAARATALDGLEDDLRRARESGDEDEVKRARAALLAVSGRRTDLDDAERAVLEAAEDHARRLANAVVQVAAEEQALDRLRGRETAPEDAGEALRKANAVAMSRTLRGEEVRSVHLLQVLDEADAFQLQDRLFGESLDIQTLRRALTRAATNDPGNRELILAQSMALDLLRVRRTDSLIREFLDASPWGDHVTVHRAANGAGVIGDDPDAGGGRDAPGIHQDLDIDFVVREGGPGDARQFMSEFDAFLKTKGHDAPQREGQRTTIGARFYAEDESPRAKLERKSGQPIRFATDYEGKRLADPERGLDRLTADQRKRLELDEGEIRTLEQVQGFHPAHAQLMNLFAKLHDAIVVVRDSNPDTVQYMDDPDYMPKPQECKAKTAKVGPNLGLVVNPRHPAQASHWDAAIADAQARGDTNRVKFLKRHRQRAEVSWDSYGKKMEEAGYQTDERGVIFKEPFKGVHGDYDLHGVFTVDDSGQVTSTVSYGDGTVEDNRDTRELRGQFNGFLRKLTDPVMRLKEMVLHGGQDNWKHPGKTSDPPVTIFLPDQVAQRLGLKSPVKLADAAAMRDFYENKLAVAWEYSDGRNDFWTKAGDFKKRYDAFMEFPVPPTKGSKPVASVGAQRWRRNQRTTQQEEWAPIPRWQTYGMLLDLLPHLEFLTAPELQRDAMEGLANDRERMDALRRALRRADAFFVLCDAWLLSKPEGNERYEEKRRAWRTALRQQGSDHRSSREPAVRQSEIDSLRGRAAGLLGARPDQPGSYRARVLADVEALGGAGLNEKGREQLALLVRVLDAGDKVDPFAADGISGDRSAGIERVARLFVFLRLAAARMVADIGVGFADERVQVFLDGTEAEMHYLADECRRNALMLEAAGPRAPFATIAFGRAPFEIDEDGRIVAVEAEAHRAAVGADLSAATAARVLAGQLPATVANHVSSSVEPAVEVWELLAAD